MTSDRERPEPILSTGADAPMSAEQRACLKRLAETAYEPEAFSEHLTRTEAELRIATLTAKLKRLGEPPHTL
ncbi:MAG TPA: DUF3072 domain-containing protein [Pseudolabrys sp.]|nr:DUF3072 domain-containing protein [Pseudolabrys sp.]